MRVWLLNIVLQKKHDLQLYMQYYMYKYFILFTSRKAVSRHHFRSLNWLPVSERVVHLKLCHVNRILSGEAPSYISEGFNLSVKRTRN